MRFLIYFLIIAETILSICFIMTFLGFIIEPVEEDSHTTLAASLSSTDSISMQNHTSTQRIAVFDHGLRMFQGSYALPADWQLYQHIETNPNAGGSYNRFSLDFHGPDREFISVLGYNGYNNLGKPLQPETFEEAWQRAVREGLENHLDKFTLGELKASTHQSASYLEAYIKIDSQDQFLEASISGKKDGDVFEGVVRIINLSPGLQWSNHFMGSILLCPEGLLSQTLETEKQIADSYEANPAFEQYLYLMGEQYRRTMSNYTQGAEKWLPDSIYSWK